MLCIVVLFCAAAVIAAPVQSVFFTTLANFDGSNGANTWAGLIQGTDRDFYGTAHNGGASSFGTVFKITPGGTLTNLHSFDESDGAYPQAGLIQAIDGNFYGTTSGGGSSGGGAVFAITPSGTLSTLYSFCSQFPCPGGAEPEAGLVQGSDGNFYGTTVFGGPNCDLDRVGCGTVFKITPAGTLTTLYSFCSQPHCTDGGWPEPGLVLANDGNFYGTTAAGASITAALAVAPSSKSPQRVL
jgi:uncharacterized repeat protein (TIGR03803 family)